MSTYTDSLEVISSILSSATSRLPSQISLLNPLAQVLPLSNLLEHVTTTPVHPTYFPFARSAVIHASRTTTIWANLTRGKDRGGVGRLQDLFGYLTLAWGGATIVAMLLSQPPSWLVSPTPWLVYPIVYTLLIPTGLSNFVVSTCTPLLLNLVTAAVDGLIRGTAIASLPPALSASGVKSSWWAQVLSGIAVSSSGWLVTGLGLNESEWRLSVPSVLHGGVLNTLDLWGGMVAGLVYAGLTRSHPDLAGLGDTIAAVLPSHMVSIRSVPNDDSKVKPTVSPNIARAITVVILASLFLARVILTSAFNYRKTDKPKARKEKKSSSSTAILGDGEKEVKNEVLKSPGRGRPSGTPNKVPKVSTEKPRVYYKQAARKTGVAVGPF